ncbi:MFS general substrate transporter [Schizophyllum commune H4-8]|uniref:MFS general substrate transporter n=1 Tax=Schizophyllum commune (strain H4-8 / FGSC 9210) TaxID=578458 RepID=UPI00215FBD74|nr:MFS general substrate transporter [Schizophyllum commune H4-8]KAI5896821.1 MFS general substrate transporter [Schizophyllum commune H4-8]
MSATMEMKEMKKDGVVQDQPVAPPAEASQIRPAEEEPPLPYTRRETWFIVLIIAIAGLFSPLPANIYFPAIPTLTGVFHKSTSDLNLTVTVYLILQGISPMVWGPVSDFYGRRPTYLICFIILVMSCLGLALVPTNAFWLLLLLRCLQSAGCSSTTALGSGVIGDISHRKDRGGYYSAFNLGPQVAPVIGPILGGALAGGLGWRSIFWFLFILSSSSWSFLLCFLPETRRIDVASRNAFTKLIYTPIIPVVKRSQAVIDSARLPTTTSTTSTPKRTRIRNPLPLFLNPAVSLALAFTAVIYSVWYCVTATISSAFAAKYPFLTEADVGLCYLPIGVGMFLSSAVHGRILDAEYRRMRQRWLVGRGPDEGEKGPVGFPIERARLRLIPLHILVFAGCVIGWGWSLEAGVHLAAPLCLSLPIGYTFNVVLNTTMTLMIDIEHSQSSSVTACTNLARCSLAAVLTAVIDHITSAIGYGWTYVLFGGLSLLMIPLIYLEILMGPRWRARREAKKAQA